MQALQPTTISVLERFAALASLLTLSDTVVVLLSAPVLRTFFVENARDLQSPSLTVLRAVCSPLFSVYVQLCLHECR